MPSPLAGILHIRSPAPPARSLSFALARPAVDAHAPEPYACTMPHPFDDDGNEVDATISVQGGGVVLESRGGTVQTPSARNTEYAEGLMILLGRLRALGAALTEVSVDSRAVKHLNTQDRRLDLEGMPYPVRLDAHTDLNQLRAAIMRAQAKVGRDPERSRGDGNRTKRIRIEIDLPALLSDHELEELLVRLSANTTRGQPTLETATMADDIREAIATFNLWAASATDRSSALLRQTTYWVFDPTTNVFGPSKFVGYRNMTFSLYEQALRKRSDGRRFDGTTARLAIEKATGKTFANTTGLATQLLAWGARLHGPRIFDGVDQEKWFFLAVDGAEEVDVDGAFPGLPGPRSAQGFVGDPILRRRLELHGMRRARAHFESLGYTVSDVSSNCSYDLRCTRDAGVLHVEVKATTTSGESILLTPNEVAFAREHAPNMALFIVHSIRVSRDSEGLTLLGGVDNVILPWLVDAGVLTPRGFIWGLPGLSGR